MRAYFKLYSSFFKIGLFTFGGGYAMLPMFERELVEKNNWISNEELLDYFAISQCTPGPIAINTATFVGYKIKKKIGSAAATLGVITPSIVIILIIAAVLSNFADIPAVQHAFAGIRVAVGALIFRSVIKLIKSNVKSLLQVAMCIASFIIVAFLGQSPVYVIIGAGAFGFAFGKWGGQK